MKESENILEVTNLKTSFLQGAESQVAVKDLSFDLKPGEVLGIVGESGSGKSVSVLSLIQLLPSKKSKIEGSIVFEGKPIQALSEEEIRRYRGNRFAMIFQEPMSALNPTMTLGKQVVEMIELHTERRGEESKAYVLELFKKVKLPNPKRLFDAYPHQASGGQLQRVMIAMAISTNPDVLIADEPTTALDVTVQKEILDLIKSIQKEFNTATIFISHDLHVIKQLCDRVIVMYRGDVVEQGSVEKIFDEPSHPYTKGLIACRPQFNFELDRLPTVEQFMSVEEIPKKLRNRKHSDELLLSINSVQKYFPAKKNWLGKVLEYTKAVDDVSFTIRKGEILGLVGESGCGKSTLGKLITKIENLDSGDIQYKGQSIKVIQGESLQQYRREVQMIFQDPYGSLNPRMKIGEAIIEPMLAHGLCNRKEAKEKGLELLVKTGLLVDHFDRYPHEFSGGQRQRICIARALSLQPQLLVCDESVSALDVSVQAQIINLLLDLRDEYGISMLFIAHDLAAVRFISDRVAVMNSGKIVEVGEAIELYSNPMQEYTRSLLQAAEL